MSYNSLYKAYLINLERAKDRLEMMQKEFEKARLPFERVCAVDAKNLDHNNFIIKNRYDRDLLPGEIGCYLSHIKTLNLFLSSDSEFAIIIEDDAKLADDFVEIIEKTLNNYKDLPSKHQWDVLKLVNHKRRNIFVKSVDDTHFIGACGTSIPITTLAAIWTRKGAQKFLKKTQNGQTTIQRPIDCELQHPWEFNLLIYNLLPSIVTSQGVPTQIVQYNHKKRKAQLFRQIAYEVNRFLPKHFYYIKQHGLGKYFESFILKKTEKIK